METIGNIEIASKLWSIDQRENGELLLRTPFKTEFPELLEWKNVKHLGNSVMITDVRSGTSSRFNLVKVLGEKQLHAKFPVLTTKGVVNVRIVVIRTESGMWESTVTLRLNGGSKNEDAG